LIPRLKLDSFNHPLKKGDCGTSFGSRINWCRNKILRILRKTPILRIFAALISMVLNADQYNICVEHGQEGYTVLSYVLYGSVIRSL